MTCLVCGNSKMTVVNSVHGKNGRDVEVERRVYECCECHQRYEAHQSLTTIRQGRSYLPLENADEIIEQLQERYMNNFRQHRQTELWES